MVLEGPSWQRERLQGGSPRVPEDPLGTPAPLSLRNRHYPAYFVDFIEAIIDFFDFSLDL